MMRAMQKPLLIAPAGNMECARAAVANGADAVYFGLPRFNARMRADNFTEKQLPELINFLHKHNVRGFCTLNTLIFTGELAEAERELVLLEEAGVDAVIVQDLGVARLARELGLRMEIHGSTQMTITSPEGVRFAERLGLSTVVIARETSLKELARFKADAAWGHADYSAVGRVPSRDNGVRLEVFVHGALCVAYSGQCLTSEAMGQRSANRGECAQACRLPYQLVVDGALKELGDRRYLLSPQDLMAVQEIPELIRLGVSGFKIEGRLKTPEYVAATCQVYRKAIDAALEDASCSGASVKRRINENNLRFAEAQRHAEDFYKLEMVFSRGLYSGWLHGVNHQQLVHARFGKKRGAFVGFVTRVARDHVEVDVKCEVKAGDGVVFDTGGNTEHEQGGRLYEVRGNRLFFERGCINFGRIKTGDRVWKTSDPQLERTLRKSFEGEIPLPKVKLDLVVRGKAGEQLMLGVEADFIRDPEGRSRLKIAPTVTSAMPLQAAQKRPLTTEFLREQLGRLGETAFELGELKNELVGEVILPVSELNRMRRELVEKISVAAVYDRRKKKEKIGGRRPPLQLGRLLEEVHAKRTTVTGKPQLSVLCRTMEQVRVAVEENVAVIYTDFEDIRRYEEAVACLRVRSDALAHDNARTLRRSTIFLATPRIQKAGEQGFFKIIESFKPDGVLIRNIGALDYFRNTSLRKVGDYSLNVANPLTADLLRREGLERLTISYDCNAQQVLDLLSVAPPQWFELTIHQHMPMFHMEHCVFAAFLSKGTDHTNCGRPCDHHNVKLRDRVGMDHPVKADVGCRNTVFHARAQSGVEFWREFVSAGLRHFRVELLEEDAAQTRLILESYRQLLDGKIADARELARKLKAASQLGVTSGTLTVLG
jgi:putative protease